MADIIQLNPKEIKAKITADFEAGSATDITPTGLVNSDRIKDEALLKQLKFLNEIHAFVHSVGGKVAIVSPVYNEHWRKYVPEFITPEAFMFKYCNIPAEEENSKGNVIPLGKWWLGHRSRKEYATATFEPDMPPIEYERDGKLIFNLWEGFAVEPKRGSWKHTLKHIYVVICNSDREKFKYVMRWLAWCIQHPGEQAETCLIFKGKKGSGKNTILTNFSKLFGRHGAVVSNREHLTGKHNAHLHNLVYLFADEAYNPGDKEVEGILKNLITEGSIAVEPKFQNLKITRNCLHICMATNNDWIIPATEDERRYFINEVDSRYAKGQCPDHVRDKYFKDIWNELDASKGGEGLAAMLYDLKYMQLEGYHPRYGVPVTEELTKQVQMSLPKVKTAMFYILDEGVFPGEKQDNSYVITIESLLEYIHNLDQYNYKSISRKNLTNLLTELELGKLRTTHKRYWTFPELGAMRQLWIDKISKYNWDMSATWQVERPQY